MALWGTEEEDMAYGLRRRRGRERKKVAELRMK